MGIQNMYFILSLPKFAQFKLFWKKIMKIRNNILNKAMVYCMLRPQHLLHDGLV